MHVLKPNWTKAKVMERVKKYNKGTRSRDNYDQVCLYKSPNGNRCAIGCFIPDGHAGLRYVGDVENLLKVYPDLKEHMPFESVKALTEFQGEHDYPRDALAAGNGGKRDKNDTYGSIQCFLDTRVEEAK